MAWTSNQELVTLTQAKKHWNFPLDVHAADTDLQAKLNAAHYAVIDYASQRVSGAATWGATVDAWTEDTAPPVVIAAINEQFAFLCRWRGDDNESPPIAVGHTLCPGAESLLYRLRDPAIA